MSRHGALPVFFVTRIDRDRHPPVSFVFIPFRLTSHVVPRSSVEGHFTFGMRLEVVVPARVVFPPKTGGDHGDPFAVNNADQRHGSLLSRSRADCCELNDRPARQLGGGKLSTRQLQNLVVNSMKPACKKSRDRAEHNEPMQDSLKNV